MQDLRHWTAGDWFLLPQAEIGLPGVLVGASGSYKWQVVFIDGKGDYATAARFMENALHTESI